MDIKTVGHTMSALPPPMPPAAGQAMSTPTIHGVPLASAEALSRVIMKRRITEKSTAAVTISTCGYVSTRG